MKIQELQKAKEKVKELLKKYSYLRDNDRSLMIQFWKSEMKQKKLTDFFDAYQYKFLTPAETIRRARQKLQEENKNLRGKNYKERKAIGKQVKMNIKNVL